MTTIRKSIHLADAPERVWSYLTEASQLAKWFHPAEGDLAQGHDYTLLDRAGDRICWGRVTEMTPPSRLSMTFTVAALGGAMTDVTWTLTPVPGGTRLELAHSGLPTDAEGFGLIVALDAGWDQHLTKMRSIDG